MTDFRDSAAALAKRLQVMKELQRQAKSEGRTRLEIHVLALWDEKDQAALDLYEKELAEFTDQVPLPFQEAV